MYVAVEIIGRHGEGQIVSIAHYFEQSGDLCCDPDCTFLATKDGVYPLTFQQSGLYQVAVRFEEGVVHCNESLQKEITEFCNDWMGNIAEQQFC